MTLSRVPGLLFVALLWALYYVPQNVYAADSAKPDVRVLIDISGSMKKSDPENLRVPAVKLLLNLAKDESRFGVWAFGQYVNNLVPSDAVNPPWKKNALPKVEAINSAGLFTNIGLALERASLGQKTPDPDWQRTLVLLSDGMVDISKNPEENQKEKQRILSRVVPALKAAGFRIHSVALSEVADQEFLKAIALQTGGSFSLARNADELLHVFVGASDKVSPPEQVPIEGDTFTIDDSVNEFTALIYRKGDAKETQLITPDGLHFSASKGSRNLSWYSDKRYDLITVYNPAAGQWKVIADMDPANRVTVISDLNVILDGLPENVLEGEKLVMSMHLDEYGRVITNPRFLELMDIVFRQDTSTGDTFEGKLSKQSDGTPKVPDDGVYSAKLGRTITAGQHTFTVMVDGKTFVRKKSISMTVHREVLTVEPHYQDKEGKVTQSLLLTPIAGLVNAEDIEITAQITDPQGEKILQEAVSADEGAWRIEVPAFGALGEYEVLLKVVGTSINVKAFELVQGPYRVDYSPLNLTQETPQNLPDIPIETFDLESMEIPSLDVEELPPDDIPPAENQPEEQPEPINEPVLMGGEELQDQTISDVEESGDSWYLLAGLFILGNVLIIGLGVFFYMKFLRKTDAEQARVVEEITQIQQKKLEKAPKTVEPDINIEDSNTAMDFGDDETKITSTEPGSEEDPPGSTVVVPTPTAPEEPEQTYVNEAEPLDLDDDEVIELDDDFDDDLSGDDGIDELDMMLSEQESSDETEDQINQTIDEMLEQPTVFPEQDPKPVTENDSDKKTNQDDDPDFDNDEFMLDNPTKE